MRSASGAAHSSSDDPRSRNLPRYESGADWGTRPNSGREPEGIDERTLRPISGVRADGVIAHANAQRTRRGPAIRRLLRLDRSSSLNRSLRTNQRCRCFVKGAVIAAGIRCDSGSSDDRGKSGRRVLALDVGGVQNCEFVRYQPAVTTRLSSSCGDQTGRELRPQMIAVVVSSYGSSATRIRSPPRSD